MERYGLRMGNHTTQKTCILGMRLFGMLFVEKNDTNYFFNSFLPKPSLSYEMPLVLVLEIRTFEV